MYLLDETRMDQSHVIIAVSLQARRVAISYIGVAPHARPHPRGIDLELSMQHDHPMVAPKLPSFTSLKN